MAKPSICSLPNLALQQLASKVWNVLHLVALKSCPHKRVFVMTVYVWRADLDHVIDKSLSWSHGSLFGPREAVSFQDLSEHFFKEIQKVQPQGPYLFAGHSFGSLARMDFDATTEHVFGPGNTEDRHSGVFYTFQDGHPLDINDFTQRVPHDNSKCGSQHPQIAFQNPSKNLISRHFSMSSFPKKKICNTKSGVPSFLGSFHPRCQCLLGDGPGGACGGTRGAPLHQGQPGVSV